MFHSERKYLRQALQDRKVLVLVIATLVLGMTGAATMAAAQTLGDGGISREAHFEIVRALKDEITLLKWIGGGIIGAMATTVALLFRALQESNTTSRSDLVEGIKRRESLIEDVLSSNASLKETIEDLVQEQREQRGAQHGSG